MFEYTYNNAQIRVGTFVPSNVFCSLLVEIFLIIPAGFWGLCGPPLVPTVDTAQWDSRTLLSCNQSVEYSHHLLSA